MEKLFSNRQDGKYNEYFNGLIAHYKHFNFVLDECDNSKNDKSIDQKLKIIADNIDGLQFIPSQMMTKITSDPKHASQIMDSFGDLLAKFQKVLSNIYLKAQTETQKQNFNQWSDVHYNNFVNPIINVLDKNPSCSDIDILAEHFESSDTNNNDATLSKNLLLILSAADFNEESDKSTTNRESAYV